MEYGIALIDKAAYLCGGSYYKLHKEWGVAESTISQIRQGKRRIPLAKVPKLAVIAGVDPKEAYLKVSIEQMPEGSEERDLLGKAGAAIAGVMLLFFIVPALLLPSPSYAAETKQLQFVYIVEYAKKLMEWLQRCGLSLARLRLSALSLSALRLSALRLSALSHAA